jgi:hypothetical protein
VRVPVGQFESTGATPRPPGELRLERTPSGGREYEGMYLVSVTRAAIAEVGAVLRARTPTHGRLRDTVVALGVATLGVDLICAVLALIFEQHQPVGQIHSFGSALFWTSTQLLTVSSQIQNPTSFAGRILDIAMEAYAITVVGTLAGSIGAFMVKRAKELEREATPGK